MRVKVIKAQKLVVSYYEFAFDICELVFFVDHEDHFLISDEHHTVKTLLWIFDVHDRESVMSNLLFPRVEGDDALDCVCF